MAHAPPRRFIRRPTQAESGKPPGICDEALALADGQALPKKTAAALARMVPTRQIAATRTMVAVDNLSGDFARALLAATPSCERADDARGRQSHPDCAARLAKLERGLLQMRADRMQLEVHFHDDLLYLALATSLIRKWMRNAAVGGWLRLSHPEFALALNELVAAADFALEPRRQMKLPYAPAAKATRSRKSPKTRKGQRPGSRVT